MIIDLFRKNRKVLLSVVDENGIETAFLSFDAVVEEEHSLTSQVTDHTIEDGSTTSDHAVNEAETLSLDVEISNYPYQLSDQFIVAAARVVRDLVQTGTLSDREDRAVEGYKVLRSLIKSKTLLRVQTHLWIYDDMILTAVRTPRNKSTVDTLKATLQFKQVRIVRPYYVTVPDKYLEASTKSSTSSVKNQGTKATKTATEAEEKKLKSIAKKWSDWYRS